MKTATILPCLDLAVLNGLFLASTFGGTSAQPWLQYSIFLMVVMWVFSLPLLYIQEAIYQVIEHEPDKREKLQGWLIRWSIWGSIVMIPPSIVFYLMIMKGF